jgi:RND family efflux transporter MFP subunit
MRKKIIIVTVTVVLAASIGLVLARNKKTIDAHKVLVDRSNIAVAVSAIKAEIQVVDGTLQLPATLEPSKEADISAEIAGKIHSLRIEAGSKVTEGQVIGLIDIQKQQLTVQDAQEALNKAEKDYQLQKELFEGNAGTAQSVKDAERTLESARTRLKQSGQQASDGVIKAPISGIVISKKAEAGEYTTPGAPLATVVDIYSLKAVVFVSEKDVYQLKLNQAASVTASVLPGKTFNGKVSFISPVSDENHNYRIELEINNSAATLKAGTYVNVAFKLGENFSALQIPKLALVEGTKNPYVYVLDGDRASIRKITVGREIGENIEVLSGLKEGDDVVTIGQINLTDGTKITLSNSKN